jgi:predicted dithiol-disulfide oxidoreductase (DUF899 family)
MRQLPTPRAPPPGQLGRREDGEAIEFGRCEVHGALLAGVVACPRCGTMTYAPAVVHLAQRDVRLLAVSRAPLRQIEAFKKRMGWRFTWVSSYGGDFNYDYHVSFTKEEMAKGAVDYNFAPREFPSEEAPGISVFYKDEHGDVFHTYSAYARGLDLLVGAYNYLDLAPKGRDEDALAFTMAWVRHHDRYGDGSGSGRSER